MVRSRGRALAVTRRIPAPWFVKAVYLALCVFLDAVFDSRPIARFWFLETVARMPYFSYISCLVGDPGVGPGVSAFHSRTTSTLGCGFPDCDCCRGH
jgi:hypothetical protein